MQSMAKGIMLFVALFLMAGTPGQAQQAAPQRLTLRDAISLALKQNLSVRVANTQVEELAGTRERRRASLLPHVNGNVLGNRENMDLGALGISFPGAPTVVGPFNHYDFRLSASQSLIDRHSYHNWKASEKQEEAAKLDYQDSRDLVIRQAAGLYLDAQASFAEAEAAEARVTTSQTLEKLAHDQHAQGLATAVDEVRAQVQLARDQQNLLVARNNYQTSLLTLAHFLGLSPGVPLDLAEPLKFHHVESADADRTLRTALEARSDYAALLKQHESLVEQLKASHARYLPTLSVNGDYGAIGRGIGSMVGTGQIQGTVTVTLFDRDRAGEKTEIQSRLERLNLQIDDLNREIEQELRKAILDLESSENQVTVTESALHLAERELSLAQDRFRNGVTDNIEVVTAQSSLASAQDDRIMALARHADAVMALARSLGGTEKIYQTYLAEP
ncbi:MAG: TolC family protein [Acidobacteriota bacterium]|nr:TolC family protein [Acidobacteriota bacterium]